MREIKFRAWVKDNKNKMWSFEKRMLEVVNVDSYSKEVLVSGLSNSDGTIWTSKPCLKYGFDDVELMQFTGLRDKNGKEIFEGDIVTCYLAYTNINGVVEWDEQYCSFGIRVIPKKNDRFTLPKSYWIGKHTKLEILGNIYENPDLLEVEK